jgi:DUF1365 family protein
MSLDSNGSRSALFLFTKMENCMGTERWHSVPRSQLFWNVPTLLCFWALIRKTGSPAFSTLYDAAAVVAVIGVRNRHGIHTALNELSSSLSPSEGVQKTLVVGVIAVACLLVLFCFQGEQSHSWEPSDRLGFLSDSYLKPQILPCRTTHTRLYPTSHTFSYSYLYAGVPIGWKGALNTFLSADTSEPASQPGNGKLRRTWFSVEGSDYLQRTITGPTDLLQKLNRYLESEGINSELYPYVYLMTAPRFLGFSFNPVSFWYLYSEQKQLAAMILEVNNTFDERRMYFMEREKVQDEQAMQGKDTFSHSWKKDFHVSPFNDRDGNYSLNASDPFAPDMSGNGYIDNTITLSSSDGRPKVVARVCSAEPPIIASNVNRIQALRFVCKWWWVGFMTNVRIVREARKLWMKNLPVFYRPEVMKTSIGRRATAEEDVLAENFLKLLRYIQSNSPDGCSIRYTAAAGKHIGFPITIAAAVALTSGSLASQRMLEFHVLSPAFYSSFVRYSDVAKAFNALCLCKVEQERLAVLSNPDVFLHQIAQLASFKRQSLLPKVLRDCATMETARRSRLWRLIALLLFDQWPMWSSLPSPHVTEPSLMDLAVFSSSQSRPEDSHQYSETVISVLSADKLALGSTSLLHFYGTLLRYLLLWLFVGRIQAFVLVLRRSGGT